MAKSFKNSKSVQYVRIDEKLCNGCTICMKACPTNAIRVKDHQVAQIKGVCIACGECIRVCPRGAVGAVITESHDLEERSSYAVSTSTALYAQFSDEVMPNDVLLALKKMGFINVYDQSYMSEMFNVATELYVKENLEKRSLPFPLISPICPVIIRLIAYRFPTLLKHILPLSTPRELVAREAKKELPSKGTGKSNKIRIINITPCPAKMICIKEPMLQMHSYLDGAVEIGSIYEPLKKIVHDLLHYSEDVILHFSGGIGLGWAVSGGEIAGLDMDCLAISGLGEVIQYLEKIEMGLLQDLHYVELRACIDGCLGGLFTVADKYRAKRKVERLVRMFGVEKRVKSEYVKKLYKKGWFFTVKKNPLLEKTSTYISDSQISDGIERQNRLEEILKLLPRRECGACGCPDCRTFAEDVVEGEASLADCVYLQEKKKSSNR
ncbi:MAG TPA: hypothetical protein DDW42_08235 [Desulfobacteraceae bacterium]|nr:hypothetical protein [Desulfobacteraceae bacterium]